MKDTAKPGESAISRRIVVFGVLLSLALFMATANGATAASIVVSSLADTQANDGACTLREAIINANSDNQSGSTDCAAGSGADTITFSVAGIITLGTSLPDIGSPGVGSDISIDGGNAITISGGSLVRIVFVACNGTPMESEVCKPSGLLTLKNLTIADGMTSSSGGAILNNGQVTVINSTFSNNSAAGSNGGAAIRNSDIGRLTVINSTFSSNKTPGNPFGGAISNELGIFIANSTFINNQGGAIFNDRQGSAVIANSTFVGNSGGAIFNDFGFLTFVSSSTFFGNVGPAIIYDGVIDISNSIIANNTGGNCVRMLGTLSDGGNNIDDGNSCSFSAANNSKSNTNPLLDPGGLKNNGGPTQTLALCTGVNTPSYGCTGLSPAIDTGNNAACGNMDQRGFVRPVDGDFNGTAICDIGAVEVGVNLTVAPTSAVQGGSVSASWDNIGNPSATDWIGLYQVGAPNSPFWDWQYVSCSKAPTVARQFGSCVFPIPVPPNGTYELRLFGNNGFDLLGGSNPFTIGVTPTLPSVTVAATSNAAEPNTNGLFTVSRSGNTTNPLTVDYTVGGSATPGSRYASLGGTVTIPASALTAPIVVSPIDDNIFEGNETVIVTLSGNPAYTLGSPSSATLQIIDNEPQPSGPSITVTPGTINRGGSVTVSWNGIVSPTAKDWIGLYQVGAPNSPFWDWEYVSCSKTATTAKVSGTCTFQIPVNPPTGNFNLRLFSNDGFNLLAASNTFVLQ